MHTSVFLTAAGLLAACSIAIGGEPPQEAPDVAKLVRDLGSPRFAVREAAEQHLVELGAKTKPAVLAGTKDADPEVARRCEVILPKIRAAERKALADGTGDWPAPAGTRFRNLVGDTTEARKLYLLMTADDHRAELADAAAADPVRAAGLYAAHLARLREANATVVVRFQQLLPGIDPDELQREGSRKAIPPADVTLALYLGALTPPAAADPPGAVYVFRSSFKDLAAGDKHVPFGELFAAWLAGRGPEATRTGLLAALAADVPTAAGAARRIAADRKATGPVIEAAVLVLGRFGSKDDLACLSGLRDDRRTYGRLTSWQVRDLAAAASLSVRGEWFWDYGFQQGVSRVWWGDDYTVPGLFGADAERNAALKKAWAWLDKQPGAPPAPKK